MPPRLYELRVFREGREVHGSAFVTGLDLAEVVATNDLLNRHLMAAAVRAGARRNEVHEFVLEVRDVNSSGMGYGQPLFRWALPVDPEEAQRWT